MIFPMYPRKRGRTHWNTSPLLLDPNPNRNPVFLSTITLVLTSFYCIMSNCSHCDSCDIPIHRHPKLLQRPCYQHSSPCKSLPLNHGKVAHAIKLGQSGPFPVIFFFLIKSLNKILPSLLFLDKIHICKSYKRIHRED